MRKKISVVIPTYNEETNVVPLSQAIIEVMEKDLGEYDYEILFIDNHSKDNTKALLRGLCANNRKIKAIFNAKNFGQARSPVYGMKQAYGDCVVRMCADFQDPVDMIPQFVREWEKGTKIVIVVPHAGTWIEITSLLCTQLRSVVVPHAGTWIEIFGNVEAGETGGSFPTRERGLKSQKWAYQTGTLSSFPTRERGLKYWTQNMLKGERKSFPTRERGLKCIQGGKYHAEEKSFPTRERGLKYIPLQTLIS